jgi:hypothetical protein
MLLKNLTKYQPFNIVIYIGFGIILWLKTILDSRMPGIFIQDDPSPIYASIVNLISYPYLVVFCKILALFLILFQGLLFNGIVNQYNLIGNRSFLPGIIYLLIIANLPEYQLLQPVFFATLLLILSWNLLINADTAQNSLTSYFNASFLLGISTIFYPNYLFFLIIMIVSTFLNRAPQLREFAMIIIGILALWYFYISLFFIFTNHMGLSGIEFHFSFSAKDFLKLQTGQFIFFVYFSILLLVSLYMSSVSMSNQKIQTRRIFKILFLWILLGAALFLFTPSGFELIYMLAIPFSTFVSLFFSNLKSKWLSEISFLFLLIITLINQFMPSLIP